MQRLLQCEISGNWYEVTLSSEPDPYNEKNISVYRVYQNGDLRYEGDRPNMAFQIIDVLVEGTNVTFMDKGINGAR